MAESSLLDNAVGFVRVWFHEGNLRSLSSNPNIGTN